MLNNDSKIRNIIEKKTKSTEKETSIFVTYNNTLLLICTKIYSLQAQYAETSVEDLCDDQR